MNNDIPSLNQVFDSQACANRLNISKRAFNKLVKAGSIVSTAPARAFVASPPATLFYWRDIAAYLRDHPVLGLADDPGGRPSPPEYV